MTELFSAVVRRFYCGGPRLGEGGQPFEFYPHSQEGAPPPPDASLAIPAAPAIPTPPTTAIALLPPVTVTQQASSTLKDENDDDDDDDEDAECLKDEEGGNVAFGDLTPRRRSYLCDH